MSEAAADPQIAARAMTVGAEARRAFAAVGRGIGLLRDASAEASALVAALAEASSEVQRASPADSGAVAEDLAAAALAAKALAEALSDARLHAASEALERRLDVADRVARELGVIAMMTKVSLADSAWARAEAESYTATLDALSARLSEVIADARRQAAPIMAETRTAARETETVARALEAAGATVAQRAERAAALRADRDAGLDALRRSAERFATDMAAQIARLAPGLQFCDELDQRLDHAQRILAADAADDAAARAAAPRIAAAQLAALAGDCAAVRSDADRALAAVIEIAGAGDAILSGAEDDHARLRLEDNGAVVGRTRAATQAALAGLDAARTALGRVRSGASGAEAAIACVPGLMSDLDLAACNAAVASGHGSQKGGVLSFLAASVAEASKRCATALHGCAEALGEIRSALDGAGEAALADRLEALARDEAEAAEAEAARRAGLARRDESLAALAATIATLAAAAEQSRAEIAQGRDHEAALAGIAEALRQGRQAVTPEAGDWARALYTTEAERRAHDALIGGAGAAGRRARAPSPPGRREG